MGKSNGGKSGGGGGKSGGSGGKSGGGVSRPLQNAPSKKFGKSSGLNRGNNPPKK